MRLVSSNLLHVIRDPKLDKSHEENALAGRGGAANAIKVMLYLSSLLENFPLGEAGLRCQLPLGKHEQMLSSTCWDQGVLRSKSWTAE